MINFGIASVASRSSRITTKASLVFPLATCILAVFWSLIVVSQLMALPPGP